MADCFTSTKVSVLCPGIQEKKKILLTPRSHRWVHYSCPRPRMRTDIDLILRWKPQHLCWVGNKERKSCYSHGELFFFFTIKKIKKLARIFPGQKKKKKLPVEALQSACLRAQIRPRPRRALHLPGIPGINESPGIICSGQTQFTLRRSFKWAAQVVCRNFVWSLLSTLGWGATSRGGTRDFQIPLDFLSATPGPQNDGPLDGSHVNYSGGADWHMYLFMGCIFHFY